MEVGRGIKERKTTSAVRKSQVSNESELEEQVGMWAEDWRRAAAKLGLQVTRQLAAGGKEVSH